LENVAISNDNLYLFLGTEKLRWWQDAHTSAIWIHPILILTPFLSLTIPIQCWI